ncbi:endonuclease/exonuclease/phosphatase family protein [Albidovulum sp.]
MRLRLASYNVHKCVGLDRRRKPGRIARVLAALEADILVLQEVDLRLPPRPAALAREFAERASGLTALPFPLDGGPSFGWHGQTILVHPDIAVSRIRRLVLPGLEPRGALMAECRTGGGPLRVVAVHLGLIGRFRRMQLAAIGAAIGHREPMPTVVIGDFNEWSHRGGVEPLGPGFRLHAPGPSFPAARPLGALDRIAVGPGIHLVDCGIHAAAPARIASDHLPIWAEIRIGEEPAAADGPAIGS